SEHDLVDSGDGLADDGFSERADADRKRVMDRRTFLQSVAVAAVAAPRLRASEPASGPHKSLLISLLPTDVPYARRFAMVRDAGFDAIEMQTVSRAEETTEIREAAHAAGVRIHSVMNSD